MSDNKIYITDEQDRCVIQEDQIRLIASKVCAHLGVAQYLLDVTFVTSEHMQVINTEHRGLMKSTDVLSFPQYHWDNPLLFEDSPSAVEFDHPGVVPEPLGDVVISLDDAQRNAEHIGQGLDQEVAFLIVHGVLHLCGHDHEEAGEEALMIEQQKKIMGVLDEVWPGCVRSPAPKGMS
ncbi:MAG: rRNA maturation RNase YbeY [Oligoflexales bacterium]